MHGQQNIKKNYYNRHIELTSRRPSPTDYERSKTNENADYFNYMVSLIIKVSRYRHEIKSRFAMALLYVVLKRGHFGK